MIVATQFTFSMTQVAFIVSSLKDLTCNWTYGATDFGKKTFEFGDLRHPWTYGVVVVSVLAILSLVRNIAFFSFTFLIANIMILASYVIIVSYSAKEIYDNGT